MNSSITALTWVFRLSQMTISGVMQLMVRGGDQAGVIGFGHAPALALAAAVDAHPVEQVAARAPA